MNRDEAIAAYVDRFGGFPYFLFMGAGDEVVVEAVERALESGERITPPDPDAVY